MQLEQLRELARTASPFLIKVSPTFHRLDPTKYASFIAEVKLAKIVGESVVLDYEIPKVLNMHYDMNALGYFTKALECTATGWRGVSAIMSENGASGLTLLTVCTPEGCIPELVDPIFSTLAKRYLPILNVKPQNNPGEPHSPQHLAWMLTELVQNTTMSETKKHRWLGYIQGCMVKDNLLDVSTERDATRSIFNGK